MTKQTFLNEWKDVKIDLFDEAQKDFIYDLLIQASLKNFEYEYNGEKLNIVDVRADHGANAIHIIFQNKLKNLIQLREKEQKLKKHKHCERVRNRMNKKHIVTEHMTERIKQKYALNIGDTFENAEQLMAYTGLGDSVLIGWINKKWIELRD